MDDMEASTTYFDNLYCTTDVSIPAGLAVPSGIEGKLWNDAGTGTGIAVPSGVDAPIYSDGLVAVSGIGGPVNWGTDTFDPYVDLVQQSHGNAYVASPSTFSTGARTFPGATTTGNLLLIVVWARANAAIPSAFTPPGGYSTGINLTTTNSRLMVFYRQNAPSVASVTVTFGATKPNQFTMQCFEISGLEQSGTAHGTSSQVNTNNLNVTSGQVAPGAEPLEHFSVAVTAGIGDDGSVGISGFGAFALWDVEMASDSPQATRLASHVFAKRETDPTAQRQFTATLTDGLPHIDGIIVFDLEI
jgi:hypothetical protein